MKKSFLLILFMLVCSLSHGQTPNPNQRSYHRLNKLGNDLTTATTRFCQNTHSGQLKANISNLTSPLPVGTVVFIDENGNPDTFGYFIVDYSRSSSNQDADENVGGSAVSVIMIDCSNGDSDSDGVPNDEDNCPDNANSNQADLDNDGIGNVCDSQDNRDSDNDGVENFEDDCPNQAGPASTNGCPGNPDLSINLNGSSIFSDCFNCSSNFAQIGTSRHFLNLPNGIANIDVFVQNTGNVSSSSSTVGIYISADNTFQSNSDARIKTINVGSIAGNEGIFASTALFIPDFNSVSGNFWLLIRVDDSNSNQESNENNNVFPLRFRIN